MASIEDKKEKLLKSYSDFLLKLEQEEKEIKELEMRHAKLNDSINDLSMSMGKSIEHLNISLDDVKKIEKNYKESNADSKDLDLNSNLKGLTNLDGANGNTKTGDFEESNKWGNRADDDDSDSAEYFST